MKNFGKKGAWAYRGTAKNFRVPHIISRTAKATDFKFGQHIQSVDPNKSHQTINIDRVVRTAKPKLVDVGVVRHGCENQRTVWCNFSI